MFSVNLAITFFAGLSLDELMVRHARLQSRSALLYLTMFEEPDGTTHKASEIAGKLALAAPVYSVRSEEHTSELQTLMRISYAVFCLKTKNEALPKSHQL